MARTYEGYPACGPTVLEIGTIGRTERRQRRTCRGRAEIGVQQIERTTVRRTKGSCNEGRKSLHHEDESNSYYVRRMATKAFSSRDSYFDVACAR